jgi:hypothetical protein
MRSRPGTPPDRHPLLEAIIGEIAIPGDVSLEISIPAPAGSWTGGPLFGVKAKK